MPQLTREQHYGWYWLFVDGVRKGRVHTFKDGIIMADYHPVGYSQHGPRTISQGVSVGDRFADTESAETAILKHYEPPQICPHCRRPC